MRPRLVAPVVLVLVVTAAGFLAAQTLTHRDAQDDAEHRAEVAATEVRGGLEQASNLVESLRRFLLGPVGAGVTNAQFVDIGQRWLSPVGLHAAAWVERGPSSDGREALRTTLVSGADPLAAAGVDLSGEPAVADAIADQRTLFRVTATPLIRVGEGQTGIFLVQSAPRLRGGVLEPGFVVLFVPGSWLVAEITEEANPNLELRIGETTYGGVAGSAPVASSFLAAGRRFDVLVPQHPVRGAAGVLPWLVLGAGILLAALAGVLASIAERRTAAQREVDRIFTLSPDPIVVVGPDGYFRRVNPAFERLLGYTTEELGAGPVLDFVHPDDRDRSLAEGKALRADRATLGFSNRYLCKDGSVRWLEWTVTRAPEDVVFAVARDITERRQTESEQAALRRVATLVARAATAHELFEAVVAEVGGMFGWPWVGLMRYESVDAFVVVATWGDHPFPVGSRWPLDGPSTFEAVRRTGRPARMADYLGVPGAVAEAARRGGIVGGIGAPIVVNGETWGVIAAPITSGLSIPDSAEDRLSRFTDLVATAIANAESREALAQLVDEQAALRRVATLVAEGVPSAELFAAVTTEVAHVFSDVDHTLVASVIRFDPGPEGVLVGASRAYEQEPLGTRWAPKELYVSTRVLRTGSCTRVDEADLDTIGGPDADVLRLRGFLYQVGSPIVVEGQLWGAMCLNSKQELPPETDDRLESFTELVATAIANSESREAIARLADEQAALRRVATLVASGIGPEGVFPAVAAEVGVLFGSDVSAIVRFDDDGMATVLGNVGGPHAAGKRVALDPGYVVHCVRETSRSARFDTDDPSAADTSSLVGSLGVRSAVASPIVVEGELWGAITAASVHGPLAPGAERRLNEFTELVATAVANTQAREQVTTLVDEQTALRRVATLVANGVPQTDVLAAVAEEVGRLEAFDGTRILRYENDGTAVVMAGWSETVAVPDELEVGSRIPLEGDGVAARMHRTRRPARIASYAKVDGGLAVALQSVGVTSAVGAPIVVEGLLWGVIAAGSVRPEPVPAGMELRLAKFTELVGTAIANAESRGALAQLADEQAALRRVATLVARGVPPTELFAAVAEEVGQLLPVTSAGMVRYDADGMLTTVAAWSAGPVAFPVGRRWRPEGKNVTTLVVETGRPVRVDDFADASGAIGGVAQEAGYRSAVGTPIVVEGRLWGVMTAASSAEQPLPAATEARLASFTDLVATAIANAESRKARAVLTEEQAALRRVATLVARDAPSTEVFEVVAAEVGKLLDTDVTVVGRYDGDGAATAIGSWSASGGGVPVGTRSAIGGHNVLTMVAETGKPARVEGYEGASGEAAEIARRFGWQSSIAAPIVVEGRRWGVMLVATQQPEPFPAGAEERLAAFTDLVATAVANTEARHTLERVAAEQAALRRVATLVARGVPPKELFAAVADEVGQLLPVTSASMGRYDPDGMFTTVAAWSTGAVAFPVGRRWKPEGRNITTLVFETGRPARIDDFADASGPIGVIAREAGYRSAVGTPIVVEGRLWGVMTAASSSEQPLPMGTEARLASFTDLVATAVANAEGKSELAASRRRIVAASDEARRRIERDLHDGVQQRLVSLGLEVGAMEAGLPTDPELEAHMVRITSGLAGVLDDLVEVSRGIHPAILSQGGLGPALKTLARRSAVPVELDADIDGGLPEHVEVAAYYIVSEALTNAAKHARASSVNVGVVTRNGTIQLSVRDDGIGGADPAQGTGLVGLRDRVEALGGTIDVDSAPGEGTSLAVTLPLDTEPLLSDR